MQITKAIDTVTKVKRVKKEIIGNSLLYKGF